MSRPHVHTLSPVRLTPRRLTWAGMFTGLWLCLVIGASLPLQANPNTGQVSDTGYHYDPQGNRTKIISPLDPNPANPTIATDLTYDSLDRNIQVVQPEPEAGVGNPVIYLDYDRRNQLTNVSDPRGLSTTYTINGLGNLSNVLSPDSATAPANKPYLYDQAGNLKRRTDGRNKDTTYAYDALNRLTTINYATGTDTVFTYDGGAGDTNLDNDGKLTKITDEAGVTTYSYDSRGRLVGKTQNLSEPAPQAQTAWTQTVSYAYGTSGAALGKLKSLTYPSGNQVNYSYNNAGRISAISLNPTNANGLGTDSTTTIKLMTNISYQPTGAFWRANWGNHTGPTPPYDVYHTSNLDGRVWEYNLGNATQGGLVRTVVYDRAGRATAYNHTGSGTGNFAPGNFDQDFSYDKLGRLKTYQMGANLGHSFDYDLSGNRTAADSYSHNVDLGSNRLLNTTGPAPAKNNLYDDAGNLADDGTFIYNYSDRGRFSSVARSNNPTVTIASYAYNGLDQRVRKTLALAINTTQYVYDEQGHLLGEYDFYGRPLQETVYLGDLPIAVLNQVVGGGTATGSVTADNSGGSASPAANWPVVTDATAQGGTHQTHAALTGTSNDSFTWTLNLANPGKYFIQARWTLPAGAAMANDATYTVSGANTGTTVRAVDQGGASNTWTYLGLMTVRAAGPVTVKLSPSTTGKVSADAVRALPVANVTTNVNYIYTDHLYAPRVIVRASDNQMVWRWDNADPFGVGQPDNNPAGLTTTYTYNPRFPGQLYDAETKLYYNTHRHYSPGIGGYTQPDPIGLNGGQLGLYSYVGGNPVNLTDPFGLKSTSDKGGIPIPIPSPGTTDENSPPSKDIGELVQGCYDAIDKMFNEANDGTDNDEGCIYCVNGKNTSSGKDYIGSTDNLGNRKRDKSDGRDREGAEVVDTYEKGNRDDRRTKEQQAINDRGGVDNLDNNRNEVAPKYWPQKGITPP